MKVSTVLLLGRPGAGKETQAEMLERRGYRRFSTGEALRREAQTESENGRKIRDYLERGELVPTELVAPLEERFMATVEGSESLVLDGMARSADQIEPVETLLARYGRRPEVILLEVSRAEAERRLRGRGRADDEASVIRERQEAFDENVEAVAETYEGQGILHRIDGEQPAAAVAAEIEGILDDHA